MFSMCVSPSSESSAQKSDIRYWSLIAGEIIHVQHYNQADACYIMRQQSTLRGSVVDRYLPKQLRFPERQALDCSPI